MATGSHVQLFISCVSNEFRSYREALRKGLTRHNVTIQVQEDFIACGVPTLDKLNTYVAGCDAVIHLIGDMTGAMAMAPSVEAIKALCPDLAKRVPWLATAIDGGVPALSYTQWEAYLALYHRKRLLIAVPTSTAPREKTATSEAPQIAAQDAHLKMLAGLERFPEITFATADKLVNGVLNALVDILNSESEAKAKPINLPYPSIGTLFKGRDEFMAELHAGLQRPDGAQVTAIYNSVHGLGGIGKTRLAVEYAWRYEGSYTALLFVAAESRANDLSPKSGSPDERGNIPNIEASLVDLRRNLAALADPLVLNLPEYTSPDLERRANAVLGWLQKQPGWLLIIDNADSDFSTAEVEKLLPQLRGGHVIITSRQRGWSRQVEARELSVLPRYAAETFLLESTSRRRRLDPDDADRVKEISEELGQLALALEQAAAYIDRHHLSFAEYLKAWRENRASVVAWFDARIMNYPVSVAITWQTSVARIGAEALCLLNMLAFFAPDPIPASLLDVFVPGIRDGEQRNALAELDAYSLVTWASDTPSFTVHRLVQDVTRRSLVASARNAAVTNAIEWIDRILNYNALNMDNRTLPEPIKPHIQSVATYGEAGQILEPSRRLFSRLRDAEEKEDLLRVQAHNIRNALSIVQGICGALARHSERVDQFEARFLRCLQAIANSHSLVVRHDWRGATVGELLQVQLTELGGRITTRGPGVYLRAQAMQSLALVVQELATNAAKHGALSRPDGRVAISWTQDPQNQEVRLIWDESGGPEVRLPDQLGFGDVVFRLMGRALDGDVACTYRPNGLLCVVTIGASSLYRSDQLSWVPRQRTSNP